MATKLLDESTHESTNIAEVISKMDSDPLAFYDEKRKVRKIPMFEYDPVSGEPTRIVRWTERGVIMPDESLTRSALLQLCVDKGKDTYLPERGWIRNGKKAETNYTHKRD